MAQPAYCLPEAQYLGHVVVPLETIIVVEQLAAKSWRRKARARLGLASVVGRTSWAVTPGRQLSCLLVMFVMNAQQPAWTLDDGFFWDKQIAWELAKSACPSHNNLIAQKLSISRPSTLDDIQVLRIRQMTRTTIGRYECCSHFFPA